MQSPPSEEQKSAARPWAAAVIAIPLLGLISYVGLGIYLFLAAETDFRIVVAWFLATCIGVRLCIRACNRRLEKIVEQQPARTNDNRQGGSGPRDNPANM
jgi:hypothetical protein